MHVGKETALGNRMYWIRALEKRMYTGKRMQKGIGKKNALGNRIHWAGESIGKKNSLECIGKGNAVGELLHWERE